MRFVARRVEIPHCGRDPQLCRHDTENWRMRFLARAQHSPRVAQVDHEDRNAEAIVIAPVPTHEREIFLRQGGQTGQFAFVRQNF